MSPAEEVTRGFYIVRDHYASELEDTLAGPFDTIREAVATRDAIYANDVRSPLRIRFGTQELSQRRLARALRAELAAHLTAAERWPNA